MIIIQLLKDTKYPANYQIIIDSSLGNYAVLRDFFSALSLVNGRTRKRSAAGGWSEAEVCAEELPLRGRPCMEDNAAASGSCCWLGRRDRATAGRDAAAKIHREESAMAKVPGSYVKFWKRVYICSIRLIRE